jgi:hypothetical protein
MPLPYSKALLFLTLDEFSKTVITCYYNKGDLTNRN